MLPKTSEKRVKGINVVGSKLNSETKKNKVLLRYKKMQASNLQVHIP